MSKKTLGYIELEWTCPNCGGKNPGPLKNCSACGAPQPEDVQFELAEDKVLKTDQETSAAASSGADIHCPYCETRNPAGTLVCRQCGGELKEGTRRTSGRVVGAYKTEKEPVQQIPCPNCATPNLATNKTCTACGANLTQPRPQAPTSIPPPVKQTAKRKSSPLRRIAGAAILILFLAACAYLVYFFTRTDQIAGTVERVNWESAIVIEEQREVIRSAWLEDIPSNAQVLACEQRLHHTEDRPVANSVEVCGTPYTVDTGTGLGEVVQDCYYEVYQDYCEYNSLEWRAVERTTLRGNDLNPAWPQVVLGENQRAGARDISFTVFFQTDDGIYQYETTDEAEFFRFIPGSEWDLVINSFNQVVDVEPK